MAGVMSHGIRISRGELNKGKVAQRSFAREVKAKRSRGAPFSVRSDVLGRNGPVCHLGPFCL